MMRVNKIGIKSLFNRMHFWLMLLFITNNSIAQTKNGLCIGEKSNSNLCVFLFDMDYQVVQVQASPNIFMLFEQDTIYRQCKKIVLKLNVYKGQFFVDSIVFRGVKEEDILRAKGIIYNCRFSFYSKSDSLKYTDRTFVNYIPLINK